MNEMVKMRALSAYELVQIWEWGQPQHPVDRARGLLTLAQPELSPAQLDQLSVGQRNTRLLMLREQTLGSTLNGYAECTACGEPLEFSVDVSTIRLPEPEQHEFDLQASGFDLHCRLPNSLDYPTAFLGAMKASLNCRAIASASSKLPCATEITT